MFYKQQNILHLLVISVVFFMGSLSSNVVAAEYEASLIEMNNSPDYCLTVRTINDKGLIVGSCQNITKPSAASEIFFYDIKDGFRILKMNDQHSCYPISINNAGQVLGYSHKPFFWSKTLGFRWIEVFNSNSVGVTEFNDLGQIIGNYYLNNRDRPFLWEYGVAMDMGPGSEFASQFEVLGYHVMEIRLLTINNKGELAGVFCYGKYNQKTKKYVTVGQKLFFWDGDVHVLPIEHSSVSTMSLNNKGELMICGDYTCIWNIMEELIYIPGFKGRKINDQSVVLGSAISEEETLPAIWKNGSVNTIAQLLDVENVLDIGPPYSDDYLIEGLYGFEDLNNQGQLLCTGTIWGDPYPCLLSPIKAAPALPKDWNEFVEEYKFKKKTPN